MTVAGYLRRKKRDLDLLAASPWAERLCKGIVLGGGAMLLAAIPGRGQSLPFGAALAAARMGVETVLCTMSLDAVANMPCNPSIGGTAKGHLVYEIDALGGEMGRAADLVTLQSRTLNTGKGAAVQSKRIQADRLRYHALMKHTLETQKNLRLLQLLQTWNDSRTSQDYTARFRVH